jgi:hypothetical protein
MHRIRVSLGPYGYWLKSRDEDDPETVPASGLVQRTPLIQLPRSCLAEWETVGGQTIRITAGSSVKTTWN